MDVREVFTSAHATPFFNLATDPWVRVVISEEVCTLSLKEAMQKAHLIEDIAEGNSLTRAAFYRFFSTFLNYGLVLADITRSEAGKMYQEGTGLSEDFIDTLFEDTKKYLYLFHPRKPFLQDLRLLSSIADLKPGEVKRISDLSLHLPGDSSSAWQVKPNAAPMMDGRSYAQTARDLVTRWFYVLPGNTSKIRLQDGTLRGSQAGSPFSEGIADITNSFYKSNSLLRSLLASLPASWQEDEDPALGWMDVHYPSISSSKIYQASTSSASALLGPAVDDKVETLLRASVPFSKLKTDQVALLSRESDPFRLVERVTSKTGKETLKTVRLQPSSSGLETLNKLLRPSLVKDSPTSIVNITNTWLQGIVDVSSLDLELLVTSKQGNAAGPKYEEAQTALYAAGQIVLQDEANLRLLSILEASFAEKVGIRARLSSAVYQASRGRGSDNALGYSLVPVARTLWDELALATVLKVYEGSIEDPFAALKKEALVAYDRAVSPIKNSPSHRAACIKARIYLKGMRNE